jgi:hypothetical protein
MLIKQQHKLLEERTCATIDHINELAKLDELQRTANAHVEALREAYAAFQTGNLLIVVIVVMMVYSTNQSNSG